MSLSDKMSSSIPMCKGFYVKDVKEFIKKQIEKIDSRIEFLRGFDGLAEAMLQKAELLQVKKNLIADAGDELI